MFFCAPAYTSPNYAGGSVAVRMCRRWEYEEVMVKVCRWCEEVVVRVCGR